MSDTPPDEQSVEDSEDISRRSYVGLLGALGIGAGAGVGASKGSNSVSTQENNSPWSGISVSDSGTDITEDVSHFDFEGAVDADISDDGESVSVGASLGGLNIVNVDDDLGVEPEEDDVWEAINDHYQSRRPTNRRHRYVLPQGRWYVETDNIQLDAHEHFEIVGSPLATLVVNDQDVDRMMTVGSSNPSLPHAQRTIMKDLRIDIRGDYDTGICRWNTYGIGVIDNIALRGERDRLHPDYGGDLHTVMVNGVRPETTNLISQCLLTGGHAVYDPDEVERGYAIGFSSEPPNEGTNIWQGCQINNFGSGFYVSTSGGQNIIRGSHIRNCGRASIRIGDNDTVQDCKVTENHHPGRPWTGLWLENGGNQVINNLHIRNEIEKDTEIIRLTQDGPARISNIHIHDNGYDGRAVRINDDDESQTILEGVTLTDRSSPSGWSDYAVYVQSSNVTFRDCDFDIESQSDTGRHGLYVTRGNVDKLSVVNCDIEADGGASLRFGADGSDHIVQNSFFDGLVLSDDGTTLEDVLWVGNRHYANTNISGEQTNWQGDFNFGYNV